MPTQLQSEPQTLSGYLRIVRRRKWAVIQMLLLGPLVALLLSLHQTPAPSGPRARMASRVAKSSVSVGVPAQGL